MSKVLPAGFLLLVLMALVGGQAQAFETVTFKATSTYKGRAVTLRAELLKPKGPGPFPAVVLMHGCGGLAPSVHRALRVHSRYLVRHGFVALNLDSFGPRRNAGGRVCKSRSQSNAASVYRQVDAFDAMKFLQGKAYVDRRNIFQMGQSHGGSVAVSLAQPNSLVLYGEPVFGDEVRPFRATAAYYPWCGAFDKLGGVKLVSPLIAFVGDRDDWTPSAGCKSVDSTGEEYKLVVYAAAFHSFDLNIKPLTYLGHRLVHDRHATRDSRRQMVAFFKKHLTADLKARTPMSVMQAQQTLKALGYDPGPIDGAFGAQTLSALNRLRGKHALEPATGLDGSSYKLLRSLRD